MVKKYRTKKAGESQVRQFKSKALQYQKAMSLAYESGLWDAAVSNAVHAVILMANAVTGRESGEYYADKDHAQAPEYLKEIVGPDASKAKEQMAQVLNMKGMVEYEARGCTQRDAAGATKRVERFFSWAEKVIP
ncbi:MAG: HEPN domain-containing protein [Actinobacteria bacterium]|nr:HEPN domain-containing protein [Actinomycetota bacterium]